MGEKHAYVSQSKVLEMLLFGIGAETPILHQHKYLRFPDNTPILLGINLAQRQIDCVDDGGKTPTDVRFRTPESLHSLTEPSEVFILYPP